MSIRPFSLAAVSFGLAPMVLAFAMLTLASGAGAQDAKPQPQSAPSATASQPAATPGSQRPGSSSARGVISSSGNSSSGETRKLPEDSSTRQSIAVQGRTLSFTATAGAIRLFNQGGDPQADIAYTAYHLDGADPRTRPVTFFLNGGPGASSAYLQLGCAGPWRLPIEGVGTNPSTSPEFKPNAETWLDFTDLVFIDPVDTGYSRFVSADGDVHKHFFSVDGDVDALSVVIRRYLEKYDRLPSPKFIVGESYGGIRAPKMVHELQTRQGVGINGLILVSPLFDYREFGGTSLLQYVISLPSMAAIAREAKHPVTRADMADVETYARGDFIADLIKGEADKEATTRLADRVSLDIGHIGAGNR